MAGNEKECIFGERHQKRGSEEKRERIVDPFSVYSYDQMRRDLEALEKKYEPLFSVYSIGTSVEGREIMAFSFGLGRKTILLAASQHAREYLGTSFLMDLAERYAKGYQEDGREGIYRYRKALQQASFLVVPMINPDGVNLVQKGFGAMKHPEALQAMPLNDMGYGCRCWKANARGVDLNRNFPVLWRPGGRPSSSGYHGPFGGSEPETRAMMKLILDTEFEMMVSIHTQGEMLYWAEDNTAERLAAKHAPYADRLASELGFRKMPIQKQGGTGGYMTDFVRYYKGKPAFTVELCPYVGPFPFPDRWFARAAGPARKIGLILADMTDQE